MQCRAAIAAITAVFVAGCGGNASQVDWGDGGLAQSDTGAPVSSSSGQPSGSAGGSTGSSGTSNAQSSGLASSSGSGSSSGAGSSTPGPSGAGAGTAPSSGADAGAADATSGNASSSPADAGGADSASPGLGDGGDPLAAARAQCTQIINQYRATLNPPSPPLQEAIAQESCVDGQAKADYAANTAHSAFGVCRERAQDECPNWSGTPSSILTRCLAQMWAEGPPPPGTDNHWLNMSNAKYTKVACGFYQTPRGTWWATQDFW